MRKKKYKEAYKFFKNEKSKQTGDFVRFKFIHLELRNHVIYTAKAFHDST